MSVHVLLNLLNKFGKRDKMRGSHIVKFPENLSTTSGLLMLLHGVISLRDATLCDKRIYHGARVR